MDKDDDIIILSDSLNVTFISLKTPIKISNHAVEIFENINPKRIKIGIFKYNLWNSYLINYSLF
jgi:hypothetical protein